MAATVAAAQQRVNSLTVDGVEDCRRAVLNAMLNHLVPPGLNTIAQEIVDCANDGELKELATHYVTSVFKPAKAAGGKTPPPSPSPINREESQVENVEESLGSSQTRPSTRTVETICLPRDGYRCLATQRWSRKAPQHLLPANFNISHLEKTETCHIIPLSLAQYGDSEQARLDTSRTWNSLVKMFPGLRTRILDRLENINNASNLLTAITTAHDAFGNFNLAFEQLPGNNQYRVRTSGAPVGLLVQNAADTVVQFQDHTNTNTPLPDPYLLEVHFIISQVLHASGLAEILDELFDDYDSLRGLASDGSTNLPWLIDINSHASSR